MNPACNPRLRRAQRAFAFLLRLYPARFRDQFGTEALQLFTDQWIESCQSSRFPRKARFWTHIAMDSIFGILREHASEFGGQSQRSPQSLSAVPALPSPGRTFTAVFLGGLLLSIAIQWNLPDYFTGTTRLRVDRPTPQSSGTLQRPPATPFDPYFLMANAESIKSPTVLSNLAVSLALDRRWAAHGATSQPLPIHDVVAILQTRIDIRQVRNTSLLEVRCSDADPKLAADIANHLAREFVSRRSPTSFDADIIDSAETPVRPSGPNRPRNLLVGATSSAALGLVSGLAILISRSFAQPRHSPKVV